MQKSSRIFTAAFLSILMLFIAPSSIQPADAFSVDVRVTIKTVEALDEVDAITTADFYPEVFIDGTKFGDYNLQIVNDNTIEPNWKFTKAVDLSKGSIPIVIKIFDDDDFLNFDIDHIDLDPDVGPRNVDLTLNLKPCSVSGEITGDCKVTLQSSGTENDSAKITFSIEIILSNNGPGLQIYCLHSPIWPQPGENITITAVALDNDLQPKEVDTLEILITTNPNPASSVNDDYATTATVDPSETDFMYLCRAADDGSDVDTDWRELDVGTETGDRAISILSTGTLSTSQDIVFIPDSDDYSNSMNANFLTDVHNMIDMYYTGGLVFIENQDKVNFWIAQDPGNHKGFTNGVCDRDFPNNWSTDYTFANAGAILHRVDLRDCASNGVFSAQTIDANPNDGLPIPFVHELGHIPFGLADEYCNTRPGSIVAGSCDGGYFQTNSAPNIFDNPTDCETDLNNPTNTCESFVSQSVSSFGQTFHTYDPPANDLMVDNHLPQFLDDRRINFIFNMCSGGGC